ncbi:MAG: glycosyltransferase family 2 protein [Bacteroidota bacterium]|nr:glycosyltransferase family 2 protein [Bacteroidota bacterium]
MKKTVTIIIPVCNEKNNVLLLIAALNKVIDFLHYEFNILFIDDGSNDGTLNVIKNQAFLQKNIHFISFSRNFGHQNALKAGIDISNADCVISMDGDMQHPPELIPELLAAWENGYDIVYTVRKDRKEMSMMKRKTSNMFYNLMNRLSDIELESGTADFRLMDRRVISILKDFKEDDLFWRGIVKWLGFKQFSLEYEPGERLEGKSKYSYQKMVQFALRGITSFSTKPLSIAIYLGFACSLLSILYIPYVLISWYYGYVISGWSSLIITIVFFGGIQLMILGIIGMYLGKLFMQSKQRPHYIIKESNIE